MRALRCTRCGKSLGIVRTGAAMVLQRRGRAAYVLRVRHTACGWTWFTEHPGASSAPLTHEALVKARLAVGLQRDGCPAGHGGGCRCAECDARRQP